MRRARMTFAYTLPCLSNQLQVSTLPFLAPRGCTDDISQILGIPIRMGQESTDDIPDSGDGPREHSNGPLPGSCLVFLVREPWLICLSGHSSGKQIKLIFTDGSIRDTGELGYYKSGTGIYRPASDVGPSLSVQLCIDPIYLQNICTTLLSKDASLTQKLSDNRHTVHRPF